MSPSRDFFTLDHVPQVADGRIVQFLVSVEEKQNGHSFSWFVMIKSWIKRGIPGGNSVCMLCFSISS